MIIGLCDDDKTQLEYLSALIKTWASVRNTFCEIKTYHSAEELIFENMESYAFDILILDIQMGDMNGIELAKKIRIQDEELMIIFLTGVKDYVLDGYEVNAFRYILKPVKVDKLYLLLDEVDNKLKKSNKKYYIFNYSGETIKLEQGQILYIESIKHYVNIVTVDKSYEIKSTINQVLSSLEAEDFISIHRSYIVNLKHVDKINKSSCMLSNGVQIPISRSNYKNFNEAFIKYYRGQQL